MQELSVRVAVIVVSEAGMSVRPGGVELLGC